MVGGWVGRLTTESGLDRGQNHIQTIKMIVGNMLLVLFIVPLCVWCSFGLASREQKAKAAASDLMSNHLKPLDIVGPSYHIYTPYEKDVQAQRDSKEISVHPLLTVPEHWIHSLTVRHQHLDTVTTSTTPLPPAPKRAMRAYLDMLRGFLLGEVYGRAEKSMLLDGSLRYIEYNATLRSIGMDMSYLGTTMVGKRRLQVLEDLIIDVIDRSVPGDFLETGVWRGGCSAYAIAVLRAYAYAVALQSAPSQLQTPPRPTLRSVYNRRVFFCDSFAGLPPGDGAMHKGDVGWDKLTYVSASVEETARYLLEYSLMDPRIVFVKGFFNESMRPLQQQVMVPEKRGIAILRLDGDMYQSTVDVLYHLYELVTVGGYVIVDDWEGFPAKDACEDFFRVHQIHVTVHPIDLTSVYFQKLADVKVQYWRYEQKKFK